jgi:hypothetical protein
VREGTGHVHIPVRRVVCRSIFLFRGVVAVVLMGLDEVVMGASKHTFIFFGASLIINYAPSCVIIRVHIFPTTPDVGTSCSEGQEEGSEVISYPMKKQVSYLNKMHMVFIIQIII